MDLDDSQVQIFPGNFRQLCAIKNKLIKHAFFVKDSLS